MQPFLAMITPIGGTEPPQPPLGIWGPSDPRPTNPIAGWKSGHRYLSARSIPQPPLGMWGPNDPRPTNPIAGWNPGTGTFPTPPTQPPLVIWGPGDPRPTLPIAGWDPGTGNFPGGGGGQPPLGFWGPNDPRPTNPIAEPPWGWGNRPPEIDIPPETPIGRVEWKTAWTPATGWVVIGIPTGPTPTPSGSKF